jgi:hypothetical protein
MVPRSPFFYLLGIIKMKIKYFRAGILCLGAGGLTFLSGCVVEPNGRVAFRPVVVVAPEPVYVPPPPPPPPMVVVQQPPEPVMVPDAYTWDGYEYVGLVGDQYFYLGPGEVWLGLEPWRLERFHGWERGHADWRGHAIRNDRYRKDARGHVQSRHDDRHDDHH